jgi:hypothetical protein
VLHNTIYPGQQIDSLNKECQIRNSSFLLDIFTGLSLQPPLPKLSNNTLISEGRWQLYVCTGRQIDVDERQQDR